MNILGRGLEYSQDGHVHDLVLTSGPARQPDEA